MKLLNFLGRVLWWLILGRPTSFKDFDQYAKNLNKITDHLFAGDIVTAKVNGKLMRFWLDDGKVKHEIINTNEPLNK